MSGADEPDWAEWLRRWDAQQAGYVADREERFDAMLDVLADLLPPEFVALDLGCGPGSLAERLVGRFPDASVIAVDMDPAMLALGRGALGTMGGRLRFVEADPADEGWAAELGVDGVDAVLSTTALLWLEPTDVARVYRDVARLLPVGGVLLNGDHLDDPVDLPTFTRLGRESLEAAWTDEAFAARGVETAEQWWAAFAREPGTEEMLAARDRLYAAKSRPTGRADLPFHLGALAEAGFAEVGSIWQRRADRVLLAVR